LDLFYVEQLSRPESWSHRCRYRYRRYLRSLLLQSNDIAAGAAESNVIDNIFASYFADLGAAFSCTPIAEAATAISAAI